SRVTAVETSDGRKFDRDVAGEFSAVAGLDGCHTRGPVECLDASAAMNDDAGGAMTRLVEGGDLSADRTRHDAVGRFEDRDVEPSLPRGGGDLEPDVAGAYQDYAPRRRERRQDAVDVRDRAQVMHAG